jgi:DNA-binding MarR family transcriptional regulator
MESKTVTIGQVFRAIRDAKSARHSSRQVLEALALRCNFPKGRFSCWPSIQTIAEDAGIDPKTVRRALKTLTAAGLISRKTRHGASHVFSINYSLLVQQAAAAAAATKANEETRETSAEDDARPDAAVKKGARPVWLTN